MNTYVQMTLLAYFAYMDFWNTDCAALEKDLTDTLLSVKEDLEIDEISWGPVAHKQDIQIFTDSLVYIVKNSGNDAPAEYTIVIRGTNPVSLFSWIFEDFTVGGQTPWYRQSPHTKAKHAYISKASDTSLAIHKNLKYNGQTILSWLTTTLAGLPGKNMKLNVTGHSLGGTMTPTLALWLYDELAAQGLEKNVDINIHSLAGLTAGNEAFVEYTDFIFGNKLNRYANHLDVATHTWIEHAVADLLPVIYSPKVVLNEIETDILNFFSEQVRALGYTQPGIDVPIESAVFDHLLFKNYTLQAIYQHVVPYPRAAYKEAPHTIIKIIATILKDLIFKTDISDINGKSLSIGDDDLKTITDILLDEIEKEF
ncbi:MAG: lipase family protein [bacterium]|nr:lipase family protein [bacterium]